VSDNLFKDVTAGTRNLDHRATQLDNLIKSEIEGMKIRAALQVQGKTTRTSKNITIYLKSFLKYI
jgi:hypothetical protein